MGSGSVSKAAPTAASGHPEPVPSRIIACPDCGAQVEVQRKTKCYFAYCQRCKARVYLKLKASTGDEEAAASRTTASPGEESSHAPSTVPSPPDPPKQGDEPVTPVRRGVMASLFG